MEYRFEFPTKVPPTLEVDRSVCLNFRGGACPEPDLIYLFGYGKESEYEDHVWCGIITHEHLHDLLHKHNIPTKLHHEIIYKMKPYIFSFRV